MTDTDTLTPVFAGMLGELEEAETALIGRQSELAKQLAEVEAELTRLQNVRAAMMGTPKAKRSSTRAAGAGRQRPLSSDAAEKIMAYAKGLPAGAEFTGRDAAEAIGTKPQGVGPALSGLVNRDELVVRDAENGRGRLYSLPA